LLPNPAILRFNPIYAPPHTHTESKSQQAARRIATEPKSKKLKRKTQTQAFKFEKIQDPI
jgi:hypothetical protein